MNFLLNNDNERYRFFLGSYEKKTMEILHEWQRDHFLERIWQNDWRLWFRDKKKEITNRLGWLRLPETMTQKLDEFLLFTESIRSKGIKRIVLLGMGGSSLAPEVFQNTFMNSPGFPELTVLDSTHPESVSEIDRSLDYNSTFFIVSSKSGTTLETRSFYQYFWEKCRQATDQPGDHFAAVTDPGSPLEAIGLEKNFRGVFLPPDDVGGRYSALTDFGLLPAALIGMDLGKLLQESRVAAGLHSAQSDPLKSTGLVLGSVLAGAGKERDKITIWASSTLRHFPDWLEQLIAESTGKQGKGLIPVVNEPRTDLTKYGQDRLFVLFNDLKNQEEKQTKRMERLIEAGHPVIQINFEDKYEIGQDIFNWEMGIAAAGAAMGIHPFNQPDVQLAKDLAEKAMQDPGKSAEHSAGGEYDITLGEGLSSAVNTWLNQIKTNDYIAIHAYLPDDPETGSYLLKMRQIISNKTGKAVTTGYGPRFLHSTGQLHKGGPDTGVFLQLVDEPSFDMDVPESGFTFGQLIHAQALGDFQALKERKRRVLRINLKNKRIDGMGEIINLIEEAI